jgi:hypothetical protein
MIGEKEM